MVSARISAFRVPDVRLALSVDGPRVEDLVPSDHGKAVKTGHSETRVVGDESYATADGKDCGENAVLLTERDQSGISPYAVRCTWIQHFAVAAAAQVRRAGVE
jgi:hypothetical protein